VRELLECSHAVAEAVARARVEVIAAYPITPQTHIAERLAELTSSGVLPARSIMVESEQSALACCIGASLTGARVFTATSSHGLAYMHELLHWSAAGRLPIVMVNVNRALGPPWNIWADQTDSLSQRDTGWLQFYCETSQEAVDNVILAYKIAEKVQLPVMINLDAFILSHINEPVDIPSPRDVDRFLPPRKAVFKLDPENPVSYGLMAGPERFLELRYELQQTMDRALKIIDEEFDAFGQQFCRYYQTVEAYRTDGAESVVVMVGALAGTGREAIDDLWDRGEKVGLARIRLLRPFPTFDVRQTLQGRKRVMVVDRNLSPGLGGIFAQEVRACLAGLPDPPSIIGAVAGLGGSEVTEQDLAEWVERAISGVYKEDQIAWINT
jgi:pyruvate/2-oxoacid:ferredoxin oxidoreductase alpha subunit